MKTKSLAVDIRPATLDDLEILHELAVTTFRETFEGQNTATDMDLYLRSAFTIEGLRKEIIDSNCRFFVAVDSSLSGSATSQLVGYVKLKAGPADTSVRGPRPIELQRLYVDRPALGKRVGAALMNHCLEQAAAAGYETLWLGVWEHNLKAIQFYRRWKFETVGSHGFLLGNDLQTDLIMERSVLDPV